jgi:hypothetical protein
MSPKEHVCSTHCFTHTHTRSMEIAALPIICDETLVNSNFQGGSIILVVAKSAHCVQGGKTIQFFHQDIMEFKKWHLNFRNRTSSVSLTISQCFKSGLVLPSNLRVSDFQFSSYKLHANKCMITQFAH